MNFLELASTNDLLNELLSRFDHAVFGGMKVRPLREGENDTPDGQIYEEKRVVGNTRTCQGLCFALQLMKQADFDKNSWAETDDSPYSEP
jgi:hypothetical protein